MNFDKNLDAHIQGDDDPNAPFNQREEESNDRSVADELLESGYTGEAYSKLSEIRKEVQLLRDKAKVSNDTYYFKKLTSIYNKL